MVKKTNKRSRTDKQSLPPIKCKGCSVIFTPKDGRQHFHSALCRELYQQAHYWGKITTTRNCGYSKCGIEFTTTKGGRQFYCCPEHRELARKERLAEIQTQISQSNTQSLHERFSALQAAGFRCSYCGRGSRDGVILEVENDESVGVVVICNLCKAGKLQMSESQMDEPQMDEPQA